MVDPDINRGQLRERTETEVVTRRNFMTSAAALAASSFVKPLAAQDRSGPSSQQNRPNILIFMPDQTQGQLALPGSPCLTPNIDRFAAQGLIFPQCTSAPVLTVVLLELAS